MKRFLDGRGQLGGGGVASVDGKSEPVMVSFCGGEEYIWNCMWWITGRLVVTLRGFVMGGVSGGGASVDSKSEPMMVSSLEGKSVCGIACGGLQVG